jgi:hypothetical protein
MARIVLGITPAARQGHISIYAGMTCEPSLTVGLIPREDGDFASCEPSRAVGQMPCMRRVLYNRGVHVTEGSHYASSL